MIDLLGNPIFLFLLFIVFVLVIRFVFHVLIQVFVFAVAGAVFPFFMNYFLGFAMATGINNIITYAILGVFVYFLWLIVKMIYGFFGLLEKKPKKEEKKET